MKKLRNILLVLLSVFFVVILAGILLARIFEQEVTSYIIKEINKHLNTEIRVYDVSLSLLKKFPDATVIFKEVLVKSANPEADPSIPDTLLSADELLLNFRIPDLVGEKYLLNDVQINNGQINLFITRSGKGNYQFWTGDSTENTGQFSVDLKMVRFSDVWFLMDNRATRTTLSVYSKKTSMSGRFTGDNFELEGQVQGQLLNYSRDGLKYIEDKILKVDLSVSKQEQKFTLTTEKFELGKIKLNTEGEIILQPELNVDLNIKGSRIALSSIIDYFPMLKKKIPAAMTYNGNLDVILDVSGPVTRTMMPHLDANFMIENASVDYRKKGIRVNRISMQGHFSNGDHNSAESSVIHLEQISALFKNSRISGNISLSDFTDPEIECSISGGIELSDIQDLTGSNEYRFTGHTDTELRISGRDLKHFGFTHDDFRKLAYKGSMVLRDIHLGTGADKQLMSDISGNIIIDKYLIINDLYGNILNNYLTLSGRIDNWYEYFVDRTGTLWTDMNIYAEDFSLDSALVNMGTDTERGGNREGNQADKLYMKVNFWLDNFTFRSVTARNIRGELKYRPGLLAVNQVAGNTMGGFARSQATVEFNDDKSFSILSSSQVNGIDIKQVFTSFNNFSQVFIQDRHLEGKVSGNIDFYGEFNDSLRMDMDTFLADADISIGEGELIAFEPLEQLSRFIDIEELEHIRFSELRNEIFIRNGEVVIPQMEINSSAMNLSASGIHTFDNYYNYKIRLSLSEVLARKLRRKRENEEEFGMIEEDTRRGRLNVYLSIDGTPEGAEISYNRKAAVANLRQQIDDEKVSMKEIIREEYGLFAGDSLSGGDTSVTGRPDFIIEWDTDSSLKHTEDSLNNWKRERFIIEFEEDTIDTGLFLN